MVDEKFDEEFAQWREREEEREEKKKTGGEEENITLNYSDETGDGIGGGGGDFSDVPEGRDTVIPTAGEIEISQYPSEGRAGGDEPQIDAGDFGFSSEDGDGERLGTGGGGDEFRGGGEDRVTDVNEEIELARGVEAAEQVSLSMVGINAVSDDGSDDGDNGDYDSDDGRGEFGGGGGAASKAAYSQLIPKRRSAPPRMKKGMVFALIFGAIIAFLLVVNIAGGRRRQRREAEAVAARDRVNTERSFSLGEYSGGGGRDGLTAGADGDFQTDYMGVPGYDGRRQGRTPEAEPSSPPPPPPGPPSEGDDTVQRARESAIGKQGGYGNGGGAVPPGFDGYDAAGAYVGGGNPQIDALRAQQDQRRIELGNTVDLLREQIARGRDGEPRGNTASVGRYSEAGWYNVQNDGAGSGVNVFDDNALFPGTVIHAILVSRIDTDYPGPIHARVTENVYDSKTGKNLLIPQGTILQGNYSSSSFGVAKVQIAWESMVVNYGGVAYQVSLGGMAGVDKRGRAGIAGTLDDHYFEWLKAAGIVSLFTLINSEISYQSQQQGRNKDLQELIDRNQVLVGDLGNRLMDRALQIQPSVKVPNGRSVSVAVNAPLYLRRFPAITPDGPYWRR